MSRTDVLGISPTERTITQWRVLVDWDLVKQRPYVIVDPMDPEGLLYLSQKDYLAYAKVSASTDFPFIVVCRPGIKRPESLVTPNNSTSTTSSQNSPWGVQWEGRPGRQARISWSTFSGLRNRIHLLVNKTKAESKMVSENLNSITRTVLVWARTIAHYAEVKRADAVPYYLITYAGYLKRILATQGQMALVLHLKVALFALYSFVSGNPLKSTYSLGSPMRLDRSGLPLHWGKTLRTLVKKNDISFIRLMASLLNIYRAMDAPHKNADITSIIASHPDLSGNDLFKEFKDFVHNEFPRILQEETDLDEEDLAFEYHTGLGQIIRTAGANVTGPSMSSLNLDAQAWFSRPVNHVKAWFDLHHDQEASRLMDLVGAGTHFTPKDKVRGLSPSSLYMATRTPFSSGVSPTFAESDAHTYDASNSTPIVLGRLHAIDEPAGKVRVVAICDYWTQIAMWPVHHHLFSILKKIGTDATFDQGGTVDRYFKKGYSPHWSFDLKSATDTIPLALYIEVMTVLLRAEDEDEHDARQRAELWAKIMTDRDFLTPSKDGYARYGTGQPMGALSSWASMALVHHALVQFAAFRCKPVQQAPSWYKTYLVLGDDIDIAKNHLVAENYQHICAELSIVIGHLKSLRSNKNCFEFANMRFTPDGNISPLSLKEELASVKWIARVEYAKRILARFDTHYTRPWMALLRKATTASQWNALIPELAGSRGNTHLNLVRFLLENPFVKLNLNERVPIGSLLEWIALLLPTKERDVLKTLSTDTSQVIRLGAFITTEILQLLDMEIKERLLAIPDPGCIGTFTHSATEDPQDRGNILQKLCEVSKYSTSVDEDGYTRRIHVMVPQTLSELISYLENDIFPSDGDQHYKSVGQDSATIIYNAFCFNQHNESIRSKLKELQRDVKRLSRWIKNPYNQVEIERASLLFRQQRPFGPSCLEFHDAAFLLWTRLNNLSKVISPDFSQSMANWLNPEEDKIIPYFEIRQRLNSKVDVARILTIFEERTRGPIRSLGSALAKASGIIIPSLPYIAFEKAYNKGDKWFGLQHYALQSSIHSTLYHTFELYAHRLAKGSKRALAYFGSLTSEVGPLREVM